MLFYLQIRYNIILIAEHVVFIYDEFIIDMSYRWLGLIIKFVYSEMLHVE